MKVVLQQSVEKLGDPGDIVEVADGYARNYLVPRGLAVRATKGMVRHVESLQRSHASKTEKERSEARAVAARLAASPLTVRAKAGEEGRLFGSVTAGDVAEALRAQTGLAIDRHDVTLREPIRSVGSHEVSVRLFAGVDQAVTVQVEAE
ncbi:MAG: 50S ribosomal protein L9 [Actinomycetota bacterium]